VCVVLWAPVIAAARPIGAATGSRSAVVAARACTITGTSGADRLAGTRRADVMCGLGGADKLQAGRGADVLRGGGANDLLQGKNGKDRLDGNAGNDQLYGGAGPDDLRGGKGDDSLGGGLGPDKLSGGSGRDIALYGQRGRSVHVTIGRGANDGVRGEHDNVRGDVEDVRGGRGSDVLVGNGAGNELFGGRGNDRLTGKGSSDVLDAGAGDDRIDAREGAGATAAQAGAVDHVICGDGEDTALVDPEDVVDPDCEHVTGGSTPPPVNHPPTGISLSNSSVAENKPAGTTVGTLSASDPDPGDSASFALVPGAGSTGNGSFQIVGSQLRTAEVFDFEVKHTFSVRVRAIDHGTPAGQIVRAFTITVTDADDAPTAGAKLIGGVVEDGSKSVELSGSDQDGDALTFGVAQPLHGQVDTTTPAATCDGNTPNACTATVVYTPDSNFNGTDTFTYTVNDGASDSAAATVSVTVDPVNDAPVASDGDVSVDEGTATPVDLGALVSDIETGDANLTYTIVSQPGHGQLTGSGATRTYMPAAGFSGSDSFTYKVADRGDPDNCGGGPPACDAVQLQSQTRTVSLAVAPVNDAPHAGDTTEHLNEDGQLAFDLSTLASDTETSPANLTYTIVAGPTHGSLTGGGPNRTYAPDANFNGADSFTYTVTDRGDPDNCGPAGPGCAAAKTSTVGTVSLVVDPVNDGPTAADGNRTTNEGTPLPLDLGSLVDDVETDDADLTYTIVTAPAHGAITGTGAALTYTTTDENFNGTDTFTYTVTDRGDPDNCGTPGPGCDGAETSATRTVSITVGPVNDTPTAGSTNVNVDEDHALPIDLAALASDVETSDANLTYVIDSGPAHGTLTGAGGSRTFTPDGDFNGSDTVTYHVSDRGDPDNCGGPGAGCAAAKTSAVGTVAITVNAVDDAPVNTVPAGPITVVQDTDRPIGGLAVADVDAGGQDVKLTLSAVHGSLTVSTSVFGGVGDMQVAGNGTTTVVVTAPLLQINTTLADANGLVYHGDAAHTGPDTLTVISDDLGHTGTGGPLTDTDTVALTIVPPNQPPVASGQSLTTNEDTAKTIKLSASDADGDPLTLAKGTGPSHGTLGAIGPVTCTGATPNVCTADVTYTPAANYNGADSFTFTANDGRADSTAATVAITVSPVNDAPAAGAGSAGVSEDTASAIDLSAFASDVETSSGNLTYTVVGNPAHGTLSGSGTSRTYTPNANYNGPDSFTYTVTDRGDPDNCGVPGPSCTAATTSGTGTVSITVNPVNDQPTANDGTLNTNEDQAGTVDLAALVSDVETADANLTYGIVGTPAHGTLSGSGTSRTYTPNPDYNGPDSFTYTVTDRGDPDNCSGGAPACDAPKTSATRTISITVAPVNDAPALQNIEATALAYTENDPATPVTATTTVSDIDSANFDTGTLTVDYSAGGSADDRLTILTQGQISTAGNTVSFAGTAIGTFTGGTGTTALVITLNANATATATQALVRAIAYSNASDNPTAARTVRFVLTDGDGGTSAAVTRAVSVTAVNDPPTLANIEPAALAYTENDPATAITSTLTVSDPDSNLTGATVQITAPTPVPAEDVLAFVNTAQITGNYVAATGTLTLTGNASAAAYQSALRAVTYRNTSENPSAAARTIRFQAQDGPNQANLSNTQSRTVTVTPVNDPPVADDESFSGADGAIGNTTLIGNDPSDGAPALSSPKKTITADILAGDTDVEGQTLAVVPVTKATTDGGTVTIEADGDFTYTPKAATSCTDHSDSFDYTLSDQNATGPGPTPGTDTGTVTIAINGCVWYVDNTAAAGGGGTSIAPFTTIDAAETPSGANDTVFVFDGNNSAYSSGNGYTMNAGERLIGEDAGLTVDPDGSGGPLGTDTLQPANPGAKPTLTASNVDVVDLAAGNEIRGLVVDPSGTGGGIAGGTGDAGGTIAGVDITDGGTAGTQPGLELNGTSGTFNVSNFTVNNGDGNAGTITDSGVLLNNAGTVVFAPTGTISITTNGAAGLVATGTVATPQALGTSTFDAITVTNSGNGGVSLTNTSGTTTFGALSLTTSSGSAPAFGLSSAGTVTVSAAGTANVSATGGPAVDVTGTSGATLAFDDVDSTNSASDGVNIAGLGAGTFTANSASTISNGATIDFDLDGGTGAVTYDGTISDDVGQLVRIANTTNGTKDFNGNITDGGDGDGSGIALTNNTGATIRFDGGLTLATGANAAFAATGGGTVAVTDPNAVGTTPDNTLSTTTGVALNITNTTIGSADLNFRSISVDGNDSAPTNGIVLNNTGTAGGLTVSGSGTAGSGGTVQDASGDGVLLTTTQKVSLSYMTITSNLGDGIGGSAVNGFALDNDTITTNGNDAASDESGINLAEVTGTVAGGARPTSITNTTISNNNEFELQIRNTSGTLADFRMSGNAISSNGLPINGNTTSPHGNLVNFLGGGTSVMTLTVTSGTFTGNWNPASPPATITATAIGAVNQGTSHTVNVSGATFTNNNVGVDVSSDPINTTLTFNIHDNTFVGSRAQPINSFQNGNPPFDRTVNGRIQNNTIGTLGVAGSGSQLGNGISIQNEGAVPVTMLISGNTIQEVAQFPGISSNIGLGGAVTGGKTTNLTITNNVIRNIGSRGIALQENQVNPAQTPGPFPFLCANVSGNTFSNIAGQAGNGQFMRFRELNGTVTVTQATPTTAANPTEVDDANGFNDPTKINISGGVAFSQPACPTPP
jgi:hypothetical protein